MNKLEKLKELLEASTPGPWYLLHKSIGAGDFMKDGPAYRVVEIENDADALLIVRMHNHLPALLDRLEKLEGLVVKIETSEDYIRMETCKQWLASLGDGK